VQQALIASGIFGNTDSDVAAALIEHLSPVRFPPGHVVFAQGDSGSCLYLIASGKVKVAYRHADGREAVLNIIGASDVLGEVATFDYGTREFTATAVTEVFAVAIQRDQLLALIAERPEITHQITRLLARRAEVMTKNLVDFVFRRSSVPRRQPLVAVGQAIRTTRRRRSAGDTRPHFGGDVAVRRCDEGHGRRNAARFRGPGLDPFWGQLSGDRGRAGPRRSSRAAMTLEVHRG